MPIHDHLHTLVDAVTPVVTASRTTRLDRSTPCTEFDVRTLANHLLGTVEAMRRIGAGEDLDPDDPWGTGGDHMHDGWRDDLSDRLLGLRRRRGPAPTPGRARPWTARCRSRWSATWPSSRWSCTAGTSPAAPARTWRTTTTRSPRALEVMDQIGEMGRSQGAFGPSWSTSPTDAPPLDQVLAQAGRDPDWTP